MTSIIKTNARDIWDGEDFIGYAIPDADPVSIETKFVDAIRSDRDGFIYADTDELVYVVRWHDGTWSEQFTIPNHWHDIYLASVRKRQDAAFHKLDATLSELRSTSISHTTEQSKEIA